MKKHKFTLEENLTDSNEMCNFMFIINVAFFLANHSND
jgi:hypothetical protein